MSDDFEIKSKRTWYQEGYQSGYEIGMADGYNQGRPKGRIEGLKEALKLLIDSDYTPTLRGYTIIPRFQEDLEELINKQESK